MPNQPRTPKRTLRVPDALWAYLVTEATDTGTTPSHIIRTLIERHVEAAK